MTFILNSVHTEPFSPVQGSSFYDTPSASVLQAPPATSYPLGTTPQWQPPPSSRPAPSQFRHSTSEADGPETNPSGRSANGNGAVPPSMNGHLRNQEGPVGRQGMGGLQDGGGMQQSSSAADQVRWHSTAGPPGQHSPSSRLILSQAHCCTEHCNILYGVDGSPAGTMVPLLMLQRLMCLAESKHCRDLLADKGLLCARTQ